MLVAIVESIVFRNKEREEEGNINALCRSARKRLAVQELAFLNDDLLVVSADDKRVAQIFRDLHIGERRIERADHRLQGLQNNIAIDL